MVHSLDPRSCTGADTRLTAPVAVVSSVVPRLGSDWRAGWRASEHIPSAAHAAVIEYPKMADYYGRVGLARFRATFASSCCLLSVCG